MAELRKSLSSEGIELLNNQSGLIAKIFSYIIEDTKGLADLRLISQEWNANVRPHVLRDFGFRKICHPSQHNYCKGLVEIGESSWAGRNYDPLAFNFKFFFSPTDEDDDHENEDWADTGEILFCKDES